MKKITGLVLGILFVITANAQINKGQTLLSGNIYYTNSTTHMNNVEHDQKRNNGVFNIYFGKAVHTDKIWGIDLGYSTYNYQNLNGVYPYSDKNNEGSAGIFYRQYKHLGKGFSFFGTVSLNINFSKETTISVSDPAATPPLITRATGAQLAFTPGISYSLCKKIRAELLMPDILSTSYSSAKATSGTYRSTQNNFNIYTNLRSSFFNNFGIGFSLVL